MLVKHLFFAIFTVVIVSCDSALDQVECFGSVYEAEVYSLGYPNISFPFTITEEQIRSEGKHVILDQAKLKSVRSKLLQLKESSVTNPHFGNMMGVADLSCGDGNITLYFDGVHILVGDRFYQKSQELLDILFSTQ